jgi:hypothetical protein
MDSIIKASFWTDSRVEEQTPEVKLACLWLISNPSRDLCGFTQVSNRRFSFETSLDPSPLQGACKGLPSSFKEVVPGVFFAVHFLRHQFGKGGKISLGNKVIVAAARHAEKLPESLRAAFFEAYPELLGLVQNAPNITHINEAPSIPHAENRHGVRVRERVGEGAVNEEEGCGEKPIALADIVGAYPRREGVAEALGHVAASVKRGADSAAILTGTRAIAAVIGQLPSGHLNAFVVSAGTFFKNERWRDDPQTWLRHGVAKNGAAASTLKLGGREVGSMTRVS